MYRTYVRRCRTLAAGLLTLTLALGLPAAANALHAPGSGMRAVGAHRYVVRQGDTLWSIATRVAAGRDPRQVVQRLSAANHLDGAAIVPGQSLVVPTA
ncbi:MAG: LysM peptidoglycan-binding domain-containing protein [Planctomycetaceae bacterium]